MKQTFLEIISVLLAIVIYVGLILGLLWRLRQLFIAAISFAKRVAREEVTPLFFGASTISSKGRIGRLVLWVFLVTANVLMLLVVFIPIKTAPVLHKKNNVQVIKPAYNLGQSIKHQIYFSVPEVDFLFHKLPHKIYERNDKSESRVGLSTTRNALSQSIKTTEVDDFWVVEGRIKRLTHTVTLILAFAFGCLLLEEIIFSIGERKTRHRVSRGLFFAMVCLLFLLTASFSTIWSNPVYFDNATNSSYAISIDKNRIILPPRKHVKVDGLKPGLHTLIINKPTENSVGIKRVINNVKGAGLLIFNIEKRNTYTYDEGFYIPEE